MTTDTTTDPELERLLNVYALALYQTGVGGVGDPDGSIIDSRAALLAHIDAHYVRRDRLVPDEWDDLDATAELLPTTAVSAGEISALRQRYLRGDGVTLGELKRAEAMHPVPGSIRAARGVLPRRPGDEPPEDAIRRLRDGG